MHVALVIGLLVLIVLGGAALVATLIYLTVRSESAQTKFLTEFLSEADLEVSHETWSALQRFAARRARWGALGGGIGFAISLPLARALDRADGARGALYAVMVLAGIAFGSALSGQLTPALADEATRVSLLQPHTLSAYLRRRELAVEVLGLIVGLAACVEGVVLFATERTARSTALLALVLGLVMTATSALALLIQRRLVRAPVRAVEPSDLVTHDIRLAIGLRDMVAVPITTTLMCTYAFLLWLDLPFWMPFAFVILAAGAARLLFGPRHRPAVAPTAHQLAGKAHAV